MLTAQSHTHSYFQLFYFPCCVEYLISLQELVSLEMSHLPPHLSETVLLAFCVSACCSMLRGFGGAGRRMCLYLFKEALGRRQGS